MLLPQLLQVAALVPAVLSESCSSARLKFHQTTGLDCVSSDFTSTVSGLCTPLECSYVCARKDKCQAFSVLTAGACQCKLFLFDACSHRVQSVPSCTHQVTVYVRSLPGVPPGRLCPSGYEHTRYGTSYKVVTNESVSWDVAQTRCRADPGLSKFADAMDAAEVSHLMQLRPEDKPTENFFLGGRQTTAFEPKTKGWFWEDCGNSVDSGLWQEGQPDFGFSYAGCTALYRLFSSGIDDFPCNWSSSYICECQSVF